MNNTILVVSLCLLVGVVSAAWWPRRRTPEARAFAVAAVFTAAIVAVVNAWKKSGRLR